MSALNDWARVICPVFWFIVNMVTAVPSPVMSYNSVVPPSGSVACSWMMLLPTANSSPYVTLYSVWSNRGSPSRIILIVTEVVPDLVGIPISVATTDSCKRYKLGINNLVFSDYRHISTRNLLFTCLKILFFGVLACDLCTQYAATLENIS